MNHTQTDHIRPTRFKELGYVNDGPNLWRFVDLNDNADGRNARIGSQYRTRAELLADLDRYAAQFGCE